MNEQIRQIAERIRGLRDIAQLSVETCAQELGIAPGFVDSGHGNSP